MKKFLVASLACLGLAVPALCVPVINVDERGNGFLDFGGAPIPSVGTLLADPGPGGQAAVLTYSLLGPPSLVAGDVLLQLGGVTFDIIRFNPAGASPGYPASVLVYSSPSVGPTSMADGPFPTSSYANVVTIDRPVGTTTFNYTPTAVDPGFVAGFAVDYVFHVNAPELNLAAAWVPSLVALTLLGLSQRRKMEARPAVELVPTSLQVLPAGLRTSSGTNQKLSPAQF